MKIDCTMDVAQFSTAMDQLGKNLTPYAAATALTRTAKTAQTAIIQSMKTTFDRPTPYTLGSTFVTPARKDSLVASVSLKNFASKGLPASVYLAPQVYGGQRQAKRSEILMTRKGILPSGMMIVPGADAKLDAYGNQSRGQIAQLLSALSGFGETGFLANKSFRRGARQNAQTDNIFAIAKRTGRLEPGVYLRSGREVKCLLLFVSHANYKPILPFTSTITGIAQANLGAEFTRAFNELMERFGDTSFPT